jgi:hypothetical protein
MGKKISSVGSSKSLKRTTINSCSITITSVKVRWPEIDLMYFNCDSISIVSNSISIMFQLLNVLRYQFRFQFIELMYFDYWFILISISITEITLPDVLCLFLSQILSNWLRNCQIHTAAMQLHQMCKTKKHFCRPSQCRVRRKSKTFLSEDESGNDGAEKSFHSKKCTSFFYYFYSRYSYAL